MLQLTLHLSGVEIISSFGFTLSYDSNSFEIESISNENDLED